MHTNNSKIIILLLAVTASCVSCGKFPFARSGNVIVPNVVSGNELESSPTKGTVTTTENISEFYMTAYAESDWHDNEDGSSHAAGKYFGSTKVTRPDGSTGSTWDTEVPHNWLNDVNLSFWSSNEDLSTASLGFTAGPSDFSKASLSFTINYSVTDEPDLIFAYNRENRKFDDSGEITSGTGTYSSDAKDAVNIRFYHALSAIRFDVKGFVDAGSVVNKIQLRKIYVQGACSIDASSGTPLFSWTPNESSYNGSASQTFEASDFNADGSYKAGTDKEFFMLPQTLRSDAAVHVWCDGSATDISALLNPATGDATIWLPGKYYTYKLTRTGEVLEIILDSVMDIDDWVQNDDIGLDIGIPPGPPPVPIME